MQNSVVLVPIHASMKVTIGIKNENPTNVSPVVPSSSDLCSHSWKLSLFISFNNYVYTLYYNIANFLN